MVWDVGGEGVGGMIANKRIKGPSWKREMCTKQHHSRKQEPYV